MPYILYRRQQSHINLLNLLQQGPQAEMRFVRRYDAARFISAQGEAFEGILVFYKAPMILDTLRSLLQAQPHAAELNEQFGYGDLRIEHVRSHQYTSLPLALELDFSQVKPPARQQDASPQAGAAAVPPPAPQRHGMQLFSTRPVPRAIPTAAHLPVAPERLVDAQGHLKAQIAWPVDHNSEPCPVNGQFVVADYGDGHMRAIPKAEFDSWCAAHPSATAFIDAATNKKASVANLFVVSGQDLVDQGVQPPQAEEGVSAAPTSR